LEVDLKALEGWCLYIIETEENTLYTGISNNLEKRWQDHSQGKGAKYLRAFKPKAVVYVESCESRSDASKREAKVKSMSKEEKQALIKNYQTGKGAE
jgi:putative endonuclease